MNPANFLYQASKASVWQGRADSLPDERMFQLVECVDLETQALTKVDHPQPALLGLASDIGVQRNLGRIGAQQGPHALRHALAGLAWHGDKLVIQDCGDIVADQDLETAQAEFAKCVSHCHQHGYSTLATGGGHEIAWAHYQGLAQAYPGEPIAIINFDAHFDLRPKTKNRGSSGTPFLQIAEYCQHQQLPYDYLVMGIQPQANPRSLFAKADELGVDYVLADSFFYEPDAVFERLENFLAQHEKIYLTMCLDVFASGFAPGVSAPQVLGLNPWQVLDLLPTIAASKKIIGVDVAELAPNYDIHNQTAQLAANLLLNYLQSAF